MTIRDTIMAPFQNVNVEEAYEEPIPSLTSFLGDEDVESDEDDLTLSEVRQKRKNTTKSAKVASQGKNGCGSSY